MKFSGRKAQVKSCIWHLQIVWPWESYVTTLSFGFLVFKNSKTNNNSYLLVMLRGLPEILPENSLVRCVALKMALVLVEI